MVFFYQSVKRHFQNMDPSPCWYKFYQRSKWVSRDLKGTKLPSICITRLMGSSYYIAVQIFHAILALVYSDEGVTFFEDDRRRGVREAVSYSCNNFLMSLLLYILSQYFPFLDRPWQWLFIGNLIEPMLTLDQAQNDLHITGMSAKFVRCLTNHHIVWKYAGHFVLGPYKKWDWIMLLMDKHFQRLSKEVKPGEGTLIILPFKLLLLAKVSANKYSVIFPP